MRLSAILVLLLINVTSTFAQNNAVSANEAYVKVITERANKIVASLKIDNASKAEKVSAIVRDQYSNLNDVYAARDLAIKVIKEKYTEKSVREVALAKENANTEVKTVKLHHEYLRKLAKHLNAQQIEGIKDGMTYGVLPLTFKAYQEEILTLTDEQKKQILTWLTEAREKAMDAESSDKKHAMFGKYKGKINNYLSAEGYDLKKEGIAWQKRIEAAKTNH
ncbi:DUF3826 domain-containing protein [Pedobacter sp. Du54]|uniref:DUF3826 domain-containing protein n=1 Tax=Pedobacter anseongensis TaxID=3133439 RepID=UPI0030A64DD6